MATNNAYLVKFTVSGSGDFPMDMLRYDACWPETPHEITHEGRREVTVIGYCRTTPCFKRTGQPGEYPTFDRWRSFMWSVKPESIEVIRKITERDA